MPKTKRTKTGYTTDADALQTLFEQTGHEFLSYLLVHRDATRLKVTVEGLLKSVADDGRIHTTYSQTIAATGRLSSTEPNLQNVPIRTPAGRRIRDTFVVGDGYSELMTADYSQIEMRIMAHLSGDAALIEAFRSHHDFHAETAARVFGVDAAEVGPERRAKIKAMNYGLAYGLSAFGLSNQLRISTEEARGLMDDYFQTFGGVRDYLGGVVEQARKDGYTETILGRRRYLPDLTTDNRQRREMAERMALKTCTGRCRRRGCAAGCCCRSTTSSCSRSPTMSGTRSRSWCAGRWARPTRCRSRWRCRWATGGAGTRPHTR
jgi:DNA polymerase-1